MSGLGWEVTDEVISDCSTKQSGISQWVVDSNYSSSLKRLRFETVTSNHLRLAPVSITYHTQASIKTAVTD